MRRTFRRNIKFGGTVVELARKKRKIRKPRIVLICDVSRSMDTYSKFLLQFIYALQNTLGKVESFVFSTRLTRVTDYFKTSDIFTALDRIAREVPDWSGGTRIGEAVAEFNRHWARRVLGQGAIVLLITDGLDRPREQDAGRGLAESMDRLHRSCRRLIWLNPLLRWEGFEPKSQGIKAMLPHVDEFRPVHNLASLRTLVDLLSRPEPSRAAIERMAS
jgi:uncharacterized protein with von Willebrand factor type A (vWA) domain